MFAILGDLHMGVKNDDPWMEENMLKFFKFFVKECKKRNITTCVQTGDWFDVRKGISHRTMEFIREDIIPLLESQFEKIYITVGNHDMHLKNKITPNSPRECLAQYEMFEIIDSPKTVYFGETSFDLIPWLCKGNHDEIMKFIDDSVSDYNIGHWELTGFYFYRGMKSSGDDPEFLKKYKKVFCGHFHTQSEGKNIQYVGTPYTITLGDANDSRGFWIFKEDETLEFVKNPITNHAKLYFDSKWKYKPGTFKNKCVRLIIQETTDELNNVLEDLEKTCHEFSFEYKSVIEEAEETETEIEKPKKLIEIINEKIDNLDLDEKQKNKIKKKMGRIYIEALNRNNE